MQCVVGVGQLLDHGCELRAEFQLVLVKYGEHVGEVGGALFAHLDHGVVAVARDGDEDAASVEGVSFALDQRCRRRGRGLPCPAC